MARYSEQPMPVTVPSDKGRQVTGAGDARPRTGFSTSFHSLLDPSQTSGTEAALPSVPPPSSHPSRLPLLLVWAGVWERAGELQPGGPDRGQQIQPRVWEQEGQGRGQLAVSKAAKLQRVLALDRAGDSRMEMVNQAMKVQRPLHELPPGAGWYWRRSDRRGRHRFIRSRSEPEQAISSLWASVSSSAKAWLCLSSHDWALI